MPLFCWHADPSVNRFGPGWAFDLEREPDTALRAIPTSRTRVRVPSRYDPLPSRSSARAVWRLATATRAIPPSSADSRLRCGHPDAAIHRLADGELRELRRLLDSDGLGLAGFVITQCHPAVGFVDLDEPHKGNAASTCVAGSAVKSASSPND